MDPREARLELLRLLQPGLSPFPYDRAALLLAVDEVPGLDLPHYERQLDRFAAATQGALRPGLEREPRERLGALRRVLYEDEGFHGDRTSYYDIRNSLLNQVLDRRLGIPISLGAICLGVARRLHWPLEPVNFPGHFLVRYATRSEIHVVDPFHGGLLLGREELIERWIQATGGSPPSPVEMLQPAAPREVLRRMLNNMWLAHRDTRQFRRATWALEKLVLLFPEQPAHERDLGYLRIAASDLPGAVSSLERYLSRAPHAPDREKVQQDAARLRAVLLEQPQNL